MHEWPENDGTVGFKEITKPIISLIKQQYRLRFKGWRDLRYNGYDHDLMCGVTCLPPDQAMTASNLQYSLHDQGRAPLDEIVALAVQLGIEQGRRMHIDNDCKWCKFRIELKDNPETLLPRLSEGG